MTLITESIYSIDPLRTKDDNLWLGEGRKQYAADQSKRQAHMHTPGTSTSDLMHWTNYTSHSVTPAPSNLLSDFT